MKRVAPAVPWLIVYSACAQPSIDDLRSELSGNLESVEFAKSLAGLVTLSDEFELSGARYTIDGGTGLSTISFPFSTSFDTFGTGAPKLYTEGVVSYGRASEETADIFGGALPGSEAATDADWTTLNGLGGIGLTFEPTQEISLTPIVNAGIAYIENSTDYDGPGAGLAASLLDGIGFNWDAWALSLGLAGRAVYERELENEQRISLLARYDIRWSDTFAEDDPAQAFSSRLQFLTLSARYEAPIGVAVWGSRPTYRVSVGYQRFTEGDLFGVDDFVQLGASLRVGDALPFGSVASLGGLIVLGSEIEGYGIGFGIEF